MWCGIRPPTRRRPMADLFIDYLSRCSFLLQQGKFVADVCYYYGDQGFNFVPPKHIDPNLGYGYDYDVANADVLLNRMRTEGNNIVLPDGMRYQLLVLPAREDIDVPVLRKLMALVHAGATVVGPKPTRANGLHNMAERDATVRKLAEELWGECDGETVFEHRYGSGKVVWGIPLREILHQRGSRPDFISATYPPEQFKEHIDYIHRRTDDADIYFIVNKDDTYETIYPRFRVAGKVPQIWDPGTGAASDISGCVSTPDTIQFPLTLPPKGSVFVVFREPARSYSSSEDRMTRSTHKLNLAPWTVMFPYNGNTVTGTFEALIPWPKHENPHIRNFSGIAQYGTRFELPDFAFNALTTLKLDLGDLWCVARVTLNGEDLGVVWKPPYQVNITETARQGQNDLRVEVANTWANRLVGDAQFPPEERTTNTNIDFSGTVRRPWGDIPLRDAGLFGPVTLVVSAAP